MNIESQKNELIKMIQETNNPFILKSIKDIFNDSKSSDFWNSLSAQEKKEIEEGIEDSENEDTIDYNQFMKKFR